MVYNKNRSQLLSDFPIEYVPGKKEVWIDISYLLYSFGKNNLFCFVFLLINETNTKLSLQNYFYFFKKKSLLKLTI